MHRNSGPPHWKLIQIKKIAKGPWMTRRSYVRMGGHIILTTRGFDTMASDCMRCAQLQAPKTITKKRRGQTERETGGYSNIHIRSTGPF